MFYTNTENLPENFITFISPELDQKIQTLDFEGMTLGSVVIYLMERAINIHYAEFKSDLTPKQYSFLFTQPKDVRIYYEKKLSEFWLSLSEEKRNEFFNSMN